ncbi:hypothetical protein CEUSTIGMA_g13763.t1 [Chlamydomonas eustigma]|uniref:Uncharacterized protein n=1 Tax=Chlamydomonas eustigma TaxID=1157962 RepID=A0A250XTD2_9CHLO|nr:hypothetical protein CEUSTIGMA_g13763.t1 [Chlamydomonas eustigma]|eukprot:GAX86351.1 hypothetical protein CEUSTIGMA_g13763.t1 [Chlamydomonas eustigma]
MGCGVVYVYGRGEGDLLRVLSASRSPLTCVLEEIVTISDVEQRDDGKLFFTSASRISHEQPLLTWNPVTIGSVRSIAEQMPELKLSTDASSGFEIDECLFIQDVEVDGGTSNLRKDRCKPFT